MENQGFGWVNLCILIGIISTYGTVIVGTNYWMRWTTWSRRITNLCIYAVLLFIATIIASICTSLFSDGHYVWGYLVLCIPFAYFDACHRRKRLFLEKALKSSSPVVRRNDDGLEFGRPRPKPAPTPAVEPKVKENLQSENITKPTVSPKPAPKVKSDVVVAKKAKQITNQPDVAPIQSENIDANTETVSDSKNIDAVKEVLPAQVTILFDYTYNRKRSRHLVEVSKVDGDVIYGFDLDRYEHLKFYLSDIKKEIVEIDTGEIFDKEAWVKKFEHHTFECRDKSDISIAGGYGSYGVLFTGFSKKRRDELEDLVLRSERFFLRTKVCMGLDMLIVGPKPGPEKLRRAEEMGIPTMDEKTFIQMIDEFRQMKEKEYKKKMSSTKNFVYINASGKVSVHQVVNITEPDDSHLFGFSTIKERPVTYCKDRIIKEFSSLDEAQQYFDALSEDELNEIRSGYSIRVSSGVKRPAVNRSGLSCCFTGFKAADKERLVAFAAEHEIRTVKKISSVTDFLVVCEDSKTIGQKKLAEAENFGVKVMFEDEFYYLLETGALGE